MKNYYFNHLNLKSWTFCHPETLFSGHQNSKLEISSVPGNPRLLATQRYGPSERAEVRNTLTLAAVRPR